MFVCTPRVPKVCMDLLVQLDLLATLVMMVPPVLMDNLVQQGTKVAWDRKASLDRLDLKETE